MIEVVITLAVVNDPYEPMIIEKYIKISHYDHNDSPALLVKRQRRLNNPPLVQPWIFHYPCKYPKTIICWESAKQIIAGNHYDLLGSYDA